MLEVVDPGLLTTIQDVGRPGMAHLGIRHCGAADRRALAACNLLVGEPPGGPAVEMTLLGASLRVREDCLVGIAGADMGARVIEEDRALVPGASYRLAAGTTLACLGATDGARTYLALAGGIDADRVLGSASTDTWAGIGGLGGGPLRPGDLLVAQRRPAGPLVERRWPAGLAASGIPVGEGPSLVAVTAGPHLDGLERTTLDALLGSTWQVSPRSDRVGIRLDGASLGDRTSGVIGGDLVSIPMLPGAVQVPPEGRPLVLLVDAPTVGGYRVPVVAIEADMPVLGQLRPGDRVRFDWLDADAARRRSVVTSAEWEAAARALVSTA